MSKYLFLFTIGPVKSFIRESRKAQDLFASSALLSNLCKTAILSAYDKFSSYDFELITPTISKDSLKKSTFPSIPNRFLASVTGDADALVKIASEIENFMKAEFAIIKLNNTKVLPLPNGAEEQLENHLDIRWAFTEYTTENYDLAFSTINKRLAGIKNYNPLPQNKLNESGRKCIVDGKLNVKFYRETKDNEIEVNPKTKLYKKLFQPKDDVTIIEPDDEELLKIWQLQQGEGISAVTLKKRLYQNAPHQFPSTAVVSLMHVFETLKDDHNFISYRDKVQGNNNEIKFLTHSNDQLFYKDNIAPIFKKENKTNAEIDACIKAHESWSKNLKIPMSTYYALIRFDGDQFGDWFSGILKKDDFSLKAYHLKLSQFLIQFADKMKVEIIAPKGRVIYAGGEDFMAMINLHYLQDSINLIRSQFKEMVSDKMQAYISSPKELTLSMGICIAHYLEPLQLVLDKTANMEKKAKNSGRNSFAIRISKHSGSQIETCLPWHTQYIADLFLKIYKVLSQIKNRSTSPAFLLKIYNYCDELDFQNSAKEVISSKMKLFINNAIELKGKEKEKVFKSLNDTLKQFLDTNLSIKDFANLLLIIDFIQRHDYIRT